MTEKKVPRKEIDWDSVRLHYQAGIRTLKDIGAEFGVSDAGILKRAKRDDWTRSLKARIDAKAAAKVSAAVVSELVSPQTRANESVIVEANASLIAGAELVQREDVLLGLSVARGQLQEIAALSDPRFAETLEAIADAYDESGPGPSGAWKTDKANELYRYIISLGGRVKMAKETAGTHGVYIPLQRKVLRMEDEANKGETTVDGLLAAVLASQ